MAKKKCRAKSQYVPETVADVISNQAVLAAEELSMDRRTPPAIVVETRGGTVVGIYSDAPDAQIILVDWDEFHEDGRPGIVYPIDPLSRMPPDTRDLVGRAT